MTKNSDYTSKLNEIYNKAKVIIRKNEIEYIKQELNKQNPNRAEWIDYVVKRADSQKAIVTVLITSFLKKIVEPNQDVRYHKIDLPNGYSGRTLDTKYVTPFIKEKFQRIAMKESGWLTRSIEQDHPFTKNFPGKIKDKKLKDYFLNIFDDLEVKNADPSIYLLYLFVLLIQKMESEKELFLNSLVDVNTNKNELTISNIISLLKLHFFYKYDDPGASYLPVIAIYSIYKLLIRDMKRYENKKLLPLKGHLVSDLKSKSIADIEIVDQDGQYFEGVEVKYNKPIDREMVLDVYRKIKNTPIERYYILTTANPNIKTGEEDQVNELLIKIKKESGIEIIVNGLINSLNYYLRLLVDPNEFLKAYGETLLEEYSKNSTIKNNHVEHWNEIYKDHYHT